MDSFGKILLGYGNEIKRCFYLGKTWKFHGISWESRIPEKPPVKHFTRCWGINYSSTREKDGVVYPWAVWAFYPRKDGSGLQRDICYLDLSDKPDREARLFRERIAILADGTPLAPLEESLEDEPVASFGEIWTGDQEDYANDPAKLPRRCESPDAFDSSLASHGCESSGSPLLDNPEELGSSQAREILCGGNPRAPRTEGKSDLCVSRGRHERGSHGSPAQETTGDGSPHGNPCSPCER